MNSRDWRVLIRVCMLLSTILTIITLMMTIGKRCSGWLVSRRAKNESPASDPEASLALSPSPAPVQGGIEMDTLPADES